MRVTNVDEPGTVSLSSSAPQVGSPLTAALSDPDGGVSGAACYGCGRNPLSGGCHLLCMCYPCWDSSKVPESGNHEVKFNL